MCDVDFEVSDIYERRDRRARKTHQCEACIGEIKPGANYTSHTSLFRGQWSHWNHCERCAKIYDELVRLTGDAIPPALDCGELWVDTIGEVPPEIDALAFWLPGDDLPA